MEPVLLFEVFNEPRRVLGYDDPVDPVEGNVGVAKLKFRIEPQVLDHVVGKPLAHVDPVGLKALCAHIEQQSLDL